jgi:hypothetical protein
MPKHLHKASKGRVELRIEDATQLRAGRTATVQVFLDRILLGIAPRDKLVCLALMKFSYEHGRPKRITHGGFA